MINWVKAQSLDVTTINKLASLDSEFFTWPWNRESWLSLNENSYLALAFEDEEVIGFALWDKNPFSDVAHLYKVLVHPKKRKKGLGFSLLNESERSLRNLSSASLYLEVEEHNDDAVALYLKLGFVKLRKIPNFYKDGSCALTMEKSLTSSCQSF